MGARGSTGAAYSPTRTPGRVIERISDEKERGRGEKKRESESLINILIRNESRAVRFVSLTVMIFRDNAAVRTEFRMSNNTRLYEKGSRTTRERIMLVKIV